MCLQTKDPKNRRVGRFSVRLFKDVEIAIDERSGYVTPHQHCMLRRGKLYLDPQNYSLFFSSRLRSIPSFSYKTGFHVYIDLPPDVVGWTPLAVLLHRITATGTQYGRQVAVGRAMYVLTHREAIVWNKGTRKARREIQAKALRLYAIAKRKKGGKR